MIVSPSPQLRVSEDLIVHVDEVDAGEWATFLPRFDDASIYQSWAYGSIHWGAGQLSHLILTAGRQVVAMAQVRVLQIPVLRAGVAYIRWGPLCRIRGEPFRPEVLRRVTEAIKEEYVRRRGLLLRMLPPVFEADPFAEAWTAVWSSLGISRNASARAYRTFRVDLGVPLEELRKNLHQRWRNYLKSAEKEGFTIREGTDIEHYEQFLGAYHGMMARKRFETTVDVDEFRRIQSELPGPLRMQVFLCEKASILFNALVVAAVGDTGIYLLAATTQEGLAGKGAHLLQWRAMEWLKGRGVRWYDLGGINPEKNPGVFQFKNGLGGQDVHQLGVFEANGSRISTFCVAGTERMQSVAKWLRRWRSS